MKRTSLCGVVLLLAMACGQEQVAQSNRPPEIQGPAASIVIEGELLLFTITASDPDDDPVTVKADTLPDGAAFEPQSGQFTWVPNRKQAGNHLVSFTASDNRFSVEQAVAIVVLDNNRPPALDALSDATVTEGQLLSLVIRGVDPDDDVVGLEALQLPRGATFDAGENRFSWRPGYDQAGTYSVLFLATDAGFPPLTARGTLVIRVENYLESIVVTDFPIAGTLGDGSTSAVLTATTAVTLDFSSERDLSPTIAQMKISNLPSMPDASWQPFEPSVEWLVPPDDGPKTVYARFRDDAENVSPRVEGAIVLDTAPPVPATATLVDRVVTREPQVTLALLAQDPSGLHSTQAITVSENPAFAGAGTLGPLPFPESSQVRFTLSAGDGARTLHVRFRDAAVNDAVATVRVTLDTTPPSGGSLAVVSPIGNGYTNSVSVLVQLAYPADATQVVLGSAANPAACAQADLSGRTPQPVAAAVQFTLLSGEGPKRVCGKFLDEAGNLSPFVSGGITLRTAAPAAVNFSITGFLVDNTTSQSVTARTGVVLSLSSQATDDLAEMKVSASATFADAPAWLPFAISVPWILSPGPDGTRTVYARFRDPAGNLSAIVSGSILLDTTGPTAPGLTLTEYDSRPANGYTNQAAIRLGLSASGGAVRAVVADNPALSGGTAVTLTGSPESYDDFPLSGTGLRTLWARFYDAAGNPSDPAAQSVVRDTTPPSAIAATLTPSGYTTGAALTVTPPNAGQDEIRVYGDVAAGSNTDFVAGPSGVPIAVNLLATQGTRTLSVAYRDLADNVTAAPSLTIVYDSAAPTGCALALVGQSADGTAAPAGKTATPNVTVSVSGCGETPVEIFLASGAPPCTASLAWQAYAPSMPFLLPGPDGSNTLGGCVRDAAGNFGAVTQGTITLDTLEPSAASVLLDGGSDHVNLAAFTARGGAANVVSVAGAVTGATEWAISESTAGLTSFTAFPSTSPRAFTFAAGQGARTIYALFRDDVKNLSAVAADSILFDTTAPSGGSLTVVSPTGNGFTSSVSVTLQLTYPSDGLQIILAAAASAAACADADLAGKTPQPISSTFAFLVPTGEGLKRVCAKLYDAAGNASAFLSGTITLDTIPPSGPVITTAGQTLNLADNAVFTVQTASAVTEINFDRYERLGGKATTWVSTSTALATTAFAFNVVSSAAAATGTPNVLKLRAVDKAGNTSPEASVIVTTDIVAPTAGTLTVVSPTTNGFTNSTSVTVQLTYPADALQASLVAAGNSTACGDSDLAGKTPQPISSTFIFLLSTPDGTKRVCSKVFDTAGNASPLFSGTITLDTIPPTGPVITTPGQTVNLANSANFTVQTAGAVTELNFDRYEKLGGQLSSWTTDSTVIGTTSFSFNVVSSASFPAGRPNLLKLRAVDKAGNVSPEGSVVLTTDIVVPTGVVLNRIWVDNQDGKATLYWQLSASADVSNYRVYYGSASGNYTASYSSGGPSPIDAGLVKSFTLSGLTNGTASFASVRPVDFAGNEGPGPSPAEVMLQPGLPSLSELADVPLSSSYYFVNGIQTLATFGNYLYAFGKSSCQGSAGSSILQPVDLSRIVAQYQGGVINTAAAAPVARASIENTDAIYCPYGISREEMVIDPPYLYASSGRWVRIYALHKPAAPQLMSTIDLGAGVNTGGLAVRGDKLFVSSIVSVPASGAGTSPKVTAVDLAKLFDSNAATFPTIADVIGTATQGGTSPAGLALTHNNLIQTSAGYSTADFFKLQDAIDENAATVWGDANDFLGSSGLLGMAKGPVVSGNYLYLATDGQLLIKGLAPIWAGGVTPSSVASVGLSGSGNEGNGGFDVRGSLTFMNGLRDGRLIPIELSSAAAARAMDEHSTGGRRGSANVLYGQYVLQGMDSTLGVFEIATPSSLSANSILPLDTGAGRPMISGGALFTTGGRVIDLQGAPEGAPPASLSARSTCAYDASLMDDTMVQSRGTTLYFYDQTNAVDRDPATGDLPLTTLAMTDGSTVTGVDAVGNYLVMAKSRGDGTWLEVLDLRKLRDGRTDTNPALPGDSRGSIRISTSAGRAAVSMHQGRALVAFGDETLGTRPATAGLYIVDLRPLLDDDASTAGLTVLGTVTTADSPVAVVGRGNYAFVATRQGTFGGTGGLVTIDITNAMTEPPTAVPAGTTQTTLQLSLLEGLAVYGSYAFALGAQVSVVDVSNPTSLAGKIVRSVNLPTGYNLHDCGGYWQRGGIAVSGTRAYAIRYAGLRVLNLE